MERQSTSGAQGRAPWRGSFPVVVSAALLLASLLPVAVAALATPAGHIFGGFVEEARDGVSYVAKTSEGIAGSWLYHDPYSSEKASGSLVYLPYILVGQLDRLLHLPPALLLHLVSAGLGVALAWSAWSLCQESFPDLGRRRAAFLLCFLGGGSGALTGTGGTILGYHLVSLDVGVSGSGGLQTLGLAPHILLAALGSARLALLLARRDEGRRVLEGAVWVLVVAAAYPQMAAMWPLIALGAFCLRPSRNLVPTSIAWGLAALPYVVYGIYLKSSNPLFADWPPLHDVDVGDPLSYLVFGHLLMLPFAAISAWRVVTADRESPLGPAVAWVVVTAVLMYTPGLPAVLHRVYYGSFLAWGVLAADGLFMTAGHLSGRARERLLVYSVAAMSIAGIHAVAEPLGIVLLHRDDRAVYFPRDEARVLERLAEARPSGGGVVMSSYLSGLWVPALSRQTAFLGFPFETIRLTDKNRASVAFYRARDKAEIQRDAAFLGIDYVLWGRYERGIGDQDPGPIAGWREVARSGQAAIYAVDREPAGVAIRRARPWEPCQT